ncbi:hypothetical protein ACFVAV_06110 [Nocardia sp. NPDC057663]|uniref:hypothetical protein n=1 Tax=Nocardia sp. NPDC057663 TaxID=3346201 RepID=UPI00366DED41
MTNAMILQGLVPLDDPSPPVWAYITNQRGAESTTDLRNLVCDSSCGDGLPVCNRHHVSPGHVAVLMHVPPRQVVASNYSRWDLALGGGYLPADYLDSARFHHLLTSVHPSHSDDTPTAPNWAPVLKLFARASAVRAFDLTPGIPGVDRSDEPRFVTHLRDRAMQVALPSLRRSQVRQVVRGPSWKRAEQWWDYESAHNPRAAQHRRHACLPVDQLHQRGIEGDSA